MRGADLLGQFLRTEFERDPARTIVYWSDRWRVPLDDLVLLLRGAKRFTKKHRHVYRDLPFSREQYESAEHSECKSIPEELKPLFKNLKACPGCCAVVARSKWDAHDCPPEKRSLLGSTVDSRGRESAGTAQNALAGDPDWPPLFFGGGLPTLGKRR